MRPRLFYFEGSEVARLVGELPDAYERVALRPQDVDDPERLGSGVLVVEATAVTPELAGRFKTGDPRGAGPRAGGLGAPGSHAAGVGAWARGWSAREVVALVDPTTLPMFPSDQVYTYLPTSIAPSILAKTLANAFAHIRLREAEERAQAELAQLTTELRELNNIGVKLSAEHDTDALLELILTKAREITRSDAGSLYLVEEDEAGARRLRFTLAQNDSMPVPFKEFTLPMNHQSVAGHVALTGEIQSLEDAYAPPPGAPFQIDRAFDRQIGYRTKSMLVVPLRTQKDEIIGVLQLINCKPDPSRRFTSPAEIEREVIPFSARAQDLAASLASQAAVALENSRLYKNIQILFEGFIKASVTAIEARDPTTAGHSFRVADMTTGLAEVVDQMETGPYAPARFTPEQMKELRYAAVLHDFGKIGVREEVLVKAKKLYPSHLELLKQRAELIKQGFELKYNQRKIAYLLEQGRERSAEQFATYDAELAALLREIDDHLMTVVKANEPSVMPEDVVSAIQQISLKSFLDHLSAPRTLITPEEARILSIPKGSLTEEERLDIQSHVVHTFQFLAKIPWTKELKGVPEIARAHHEKLDGTGYPYGMRADQIPLQSKIVTIADIFDALTAADRPYKRAVPVDRALGILEYERKAGAIDGTLLDLFIAAKVYERILARP